MTEHTPSDPWPAPRPGGPVRTAVSLPGSKSLTNRALVLAALADGPSVVRRALRSRDTELMAAALTTLGSPVDATGDDWKVSPGPISGRGTIDCGLAGTVMRFVPPVAALADGPVVFDGDPHARTRPMHAVLRGLRGLGVEIDDEGRGALPFTVLGRGHVRGGEVTIDASASSQFISALLLAGARYDGGVDVRHDGKPVPSLPHIDMTVEQLRAHGIEVDDSDANRWRVLPGDIRAVDVPVEPDLSNAAPFLMLAMTSEGEVRIPGWPRATTQAGDALRELLAAMGADVRLDSSGLTVTGTGTISGLTADLHDVGELTPVLAALAALADQPSTFTGIGHLRGHETDRLAALCTELTNLGGDVAEHADGLSITPRELHGGVWRAYADHRMATAGALVGLAVPGVAIDDIGCTDKTIPDFPARWTALLSS